MVWSIVLNSPLVGYKHRRHNCGSEASVTDIPAGTAPQLQMCLQTFTEMHACIRCVKWPGAIVTNVPAVSEQSLKTWVLQQA